MDFAKKQLEKYGWKDGEGLGRECQGIAVAIKPSLKTGKEGMGYELGHELTDTWWTKAYSDSLSRINVTMDEIQGEVAVTIQEDDVDPSPSKKKKSKKSVVEITEERPMDKMRRKIMKANFTPFSKGGTLNNGELVDESPAVEESDANKPPKFKMLSDEELLKACGGRTLHKAARFGLKLNGKLARIAAQENSSVDISSSNNNSNDDDDETSKSKKKKKRKRKISES